MRTLGKRAELLICDLTPDYDSPCVIHRPERVAQVGRERTARRCSAPTHEQSWAGGESHRPARPFVDNLITRREVTGRRKHSLKVHR
jgi:hypothetical protein